MRCTAFVIWVVTTKNGGHTMVEFETMKAEEVKFGKNNFLEVARKKAKAEEGENEFIAISRGFFLPDGTNPQHQLLIASQ